MQQLNIFTAGQERGIKPPPHTWFSAFVLELILLWGMLGKCQRAKQRSGRKRCW